ncbi:MAG: hypothetical protein SFY68_06365 [Candidatus Sumerlaeia bacterium]|nr:hypothetical protein [Candidatus Sumerlaeia bacterium]
MPAILTEMGFIDSPTDHPFCSSDVQCQRYALGMLYAVQRHFGQARFDPTPPPATTLIVDNSDPAPAYTEVGSWGSSASTGFFGTNSRFSTVATRTNSATWSATIPEAGEYQVSAWWVQGTNRSNAAVYLVEDRFGRRPFTVNQELNGSAWNPLGTFSFPAGFTTKVTLSCELSSDEGVAGTVVSADAIRFVRVGPLVDKPVKSLYLIY